MADLSRKVLMSSIDSMQEGLQAINKIVVEAKKFPSLAFPSSPEATKAKAALTQHGSESQRR
jgi:hypothetical protein